MNYKITMYKRLELSLTEQEFIILYKKYSIAELAEYLKVTKSVINRYLFEHKITNKTEVDQLDYIPVPRIVVGNTIHDVKVYTQEEYKKAFAKKRVVKDLEDFINVMQVQLDSRTSFK